MTISELIAKLNQVKKDHGDLPVWLDNSDYRVDDYESEGKVEVRDEIKSSHKLCSSTLFSPKRVVLG